MGDHSVNIISKIKAQTQGFYECKTLFEDDGSSLKIHFHRVPLDEWITEDLLPLANIYPNEQKGESPAEEARKKALEEMAAELGQEQDGASLRGKRIISTLLTRSCESFRDPIYGPMLFACQADMDEAMKGKEGHPGGILIDTLGADAMGLMEAISKCSGLSGARAGTARKFPQK